MTKCSQNHQATRTKNDSSDATKKNNDLAIVSLLHSNNFIARPIAVAPGV